MEITRSKVVGVQPGHAGRFVGLVLLIALTSCSGKITQFPPSATSPATQEATREPTVTSPAETATTAATATPKFEPGECAKRVTIGLPHQCGWLVVPEDRTRPDGRLVRLPVVVFKARTSDPKPDPVIYLAGGGGANQMAMMRLYSDFVSAVVSERDFIMYNQRGAPLSEPALEYAGIGDLLWELAERHPSIDKRSLRLAEFWSECSSDLAAQGIDLDMYSTSANAADADDLCIALGYDQANYYGTSYGTRIGLFLRRELSALGAALFTRSLSAISPQNSSWLCRICSPIRRKPCWLSTAILDDPACA